MCLICCVQANSPGQMQTHLGARLCKLWSDCQTKFVPFCNTVQIDHSNEPSSQMRAKRPLREDFGGRRSSSSSSSLRPSPFFRSASATWPSCSLIKLAAKHKLGRQCSECWRLVGQKQTTTSANYKQTS